MRILCNRWNLSDFYYEYWLPVLYAPWFWQSHLLKTNQLSGADVAARMARLFHKPLIARCGYMWSEFIRREQGAESVAVQRAYKIESEVFEAANRIVVTTPMMAADIVQRLPDVEDRIVIIPNYVDTKLFCPIPGLEPEFDIIFVGRLMSQKNVAALLKAIQSLNARGLIIGSGELKIQLQQEFGTLHERLHWQENVPNTMLPQFLNRARLFVLPSYYEGHPKALLEAMSCGLPVIGTDAPGIREVIQHGENGWLCAPNVDSIRTAIQYLLMQPELRDKLGHNARQYALEHFSLDKIAEIEMAFLMEVLGI
jgi:glycosyltransferase involved in cell wall biosynthesis